MTAMVPWQVFTSPAAKWAEQPSFVIGEWLFIACAVAAMWHARRCGRDHLLVAVAALVAGTANDWLFMLLPVVDNFWQAQATVMLGPRMPLYIPCVYLCFMYVPTVAVWRLGVPPLAGAAATGLLASAYYGAYDIVGADFLWWTWHDTDRAIAHRLLGVPIGSTMFVMTFVATFAWLLRRVVDRGPLDGRRFALGLLLVAALTSIGMVAQITVLQPLDGGVPGPRGLVVLVVAYAAMVAAGRRGSASRSFAADRGLLLAVVAVQLGLLAIAVVFDPTTHASTSLHQTYGPCGVEAKDITGNLRHEYVCARDLDEDYDFHCVDAPPPDFTDWYTVCGRANADAAARLLAIAAFAGFTIAAFTGLLGRRRT